MSRDGPLCLVVNSYRMANLKILVKLKNLKNLKIMHIHIFACILVLIGFVLPVRTGPYPECLSDFFDNFEYICTATSVGMCDSGQHLRVPESNCIPPVNTNEICVPCEDDTFLPQPNTCDVCQPRTKCGPGEIEKPVSRPTATFDRVCIPSPPATPSCNCPSVTPTECPCVTPTERPPCPTCSTPIVCKMESSTDGGNLSTQGLGGKGTADPQRLPEDGYWKPIAIIFIVLSAVLFIICIIQVAVIMKYRRDIGNNRKNAPVVNGNAGEEVAMRRHNASEDASKVPGEGPRSSASGAPHVSQESQAKSPTVTGCQGNNQENAPKANGNAAAHNPGAPAMPPWEPVPQQDANKLPSSRVRGSAPPDDGGYRSGTPHASPGLCLANGPTTGSGVAPRRNLDAPTCTVAEITEQPTEDVPLLENATIATLPSEVGDSKSGHTYASPKSLSDSTPGPSTSDPKSREPISADHTASTLGNPKRVTDCNEEHMDFVADNIDHTKRMGFYAKLGLNTKDVARAEHDCHSHRIGEKIRAVLLDCFLQSSEDTSIWKLLTALDESKNLNVRKTFERTFHTSRGLIVQLPSP